MFNIFKKKPIEPVKNCTDCKWGEMPKIELHKLLWGLECRSPEVQRISEKTAEIAFYARKEKNKCGKRAIYFEAKNEGTA